MPIDWGSYIKNIGAGISACMLVYETGRKIYERRKGNATRRRQDKGVDISNEIKQRLRHLISRYYFNRVVIVAYTNGTKSLAGESFEYITITHEETDEETAPLIQKYNRYPSSPFSETTALLRDSSHGWVIIDNDTADPVVASIQRNAKLVWSIRAMLGKELREGAIVASFTHKDNIVSLDEDGIQEFLKIAAEIGALKRSALKQSTVRRLWKWAVKG